MLEGEHFRQTGLRSMEGFSQKIFTAPVFSSSAYGKGQGNNLISYHPLLIIHSQVGEEIFILPLNGTPMLVLVTILLMHKILIIRNEI